MNEESLKELSESIRAQGVMQPLLVRSVGNSKYEIIAGERRFRAAQIAGLADVPVIVRDVDDQAALAMALIENLQREDLTALEEAQGIDRLIREFGLTHEQAAQAVGRSRSATTNLIRLLQLPIAVQDMLRNQGLEAGHARALLPLPPAQARALAEKIVQERLSVREGENFDDGITEEEALELLELDMPEAIECVSNFVDVDLTDDQYAALISFVFNVGCGAFRNSTMLKLINSNMIESAAQQFMRWNKAGGKVVKGLTNRRAAERDLFLS